MELLWCCSSTDLPAVKRSDGRKGSTIPLATVENLLRDNENAFEEIYCQVLEVRPCERFFFFSF
jgi:hypothetical protein